jgi:hypothetical protein
MKIKRTDRRLVVAGAHPFFAQHKDLWTRLRNGETIDVPDDQINTLQQVYTDTIQLVKQKATRDIEPEGKGDQNAH